jgi:hypothetical protein
MEPFRVYVDGQHKEVRRSVLSGAFTMAKLFAQIAGPRTYFVERILAFGLSSLCLVVDAWAVYHTINGFYRVTSVPWICLAYVLALWVVEIGLAAVAINLLRFSFSTRPDDLRRV